MLSNNNKLTQMSDKRPHYGLRKLSVGVASVLLSTTVLMGMAETAHADNQPVNNNDQEQVANSGSQQSNSASATPTSTNPSQPATTSNSGSNQPASEIPAANTSLNDLVDGTHIKVTKNEVTETAGNDAAGTSGITTLNLGLNISPDEV